MTCKALELLKNEQGFFLMVEGSQIDWAGHNHDTKALVRRVLEFAHKHKGVLAVWSAGKVSDELGWTQVFVLLGFCAILATLSAFMMSLSYKAPKE